MMLVLAFAGATWVGLAGYVFGWDGVKPRAFLYLALGLAYIAAAVLA